MHVAATFGRLVFALGLMGIGLQHVLLADFPSLFAPVPSGVPARALWANLTGVLMMIASAAIIANVRPRLAALLLVFMLFAASALLFLPKVIAVPSSGAAWVGAFELIALAGTALVVAAVAPADEWLPPRCNVWVDRLVTPGLICFGVSSMVFGIVHFFYARAIAGMIPLWVPGAPAWAYALGGARIAAGVSIITRVQARLAATLMAVMYALWIVLIHLPQVQRPESEAADWTFLLLAVALFGGSLLAVAFVQDRRAFFWIHALTRTGGDRAS